MNRLMPAIALVAAAMTSVALGAKVKPGKVPVFVTSSGATAGFTDPDTGRADSVKDIRHRLGRAGNVRVVDDRDVAAMVLEVQSRETKNGRSYVVVLPFSATLTGTSFSSGSISAYYNADEDVSRQVDEWAKRNRAPLQVRR